MNLITDMMKIQFILTLCSLSQATYVNRIVNNNRLRAPTPFRPGFAVQRIWTHPRIVQAASNRAPYILYRNPGNKLLSKHYSLPARQFYKGPWKTSARQPPFSVSTTEYEFIRAASAPPASSSDGGAIHTIPAPNLSLSEKPIVVLDNSVDVKDAATEESKPTYEVTEKYPEAVYQMPKLERPAGFSKTTSIATPTLQALIGSGAPFGLSPNYDISTLNVQSPPENEQYSSQGFNGLPTKQELKNSGAEGIIIPPNALYHNDPMFVQKLQNHLLQQYSTVEFIPYAASVPQVEIQPGPSSQGQPIVVVHEEDLRQEPSSFIPSIGKNIFQRHIPKNSFIKVIPAFIMNNVTEKSQQSTPQSQNVTVKLVVANVQTEPTTIKYINENTTEEATTPIYYAQVGQTVGHMEANGFYAAMNDAALNEVKDTTALVEEKSQPTTITEAATAITTTTTGNPEFKHSAQNNTNKTSVLSNLNDNSIAKPENAVNISYTFLRNDPLNNTDEKDPKMIKDGAVYAGQIVEATISEDHDFNKEKANLLLKRAPLRLLSIAEVNPITTEAPKTVVETAAASNVLPKIAIINGKVTPKNKMIFDDKTGEPILRIYASYVNNPAHNKVDNKNRVEPAPVTEVAQNWKSFTLQSAEKTQGFEGNQFAQFGLKLRLRKENYVPLFEDYEK